MFSPVVFTKKALESSEGSLQFNLQRLEELRSQFAPHLEVVLLWIDLGGAAFAAVEEREVVAFMRGRSPNLSLSSRQEVFLGRQCDCFDAVYQFVSKVCGSGKGLKGATSGLLKSFG